MLSPRGIPATATMAQSTPADSVSRVISDLPRGWVCGFKDMPLSKSLKSLSPTFKSICVTVILFVVIGEFVIQPSSGSKQRKASPIHIAAILPKSERMLFSISRMTPAFEVAKETVEKKGLLADYELAATFEDSKCSGRDAPIKAFDIYRNIGVQLFLGPVCDYALAPIARYAPFWNIPVISPGGLAHDFGADKTVPNMEFPTLTRIGATFNTLAQCVIRLVKTFSWRRVKVIYTGNGLEEVSPRFCFLAIGALINYIKHHKEVKYDFFSYDRNIHTVDHVLKEEVGVKHSSK